MASILDIIVRAQNKASEVLNRVGADGVSNIDRIQTKMSKTGLIMSAAVTAPIALMAGKAIAAASDLGESVNAVGVVFGKAGQKIIEFGKNAATEAGLSMRALNELVTPVGASLINVGFSADQAADASINLAKRAADMASVFNVDVSTAMEAIQSALRGEANPIERFGVGVSAAAVQAKALAMGLAETADGLDANDLAQARLAIIMEQTNALSGDFKNTSDGLANTQRINAAEAENMAVKFGEKLVPIQTTLLGILSKLIDFFSSMSSEMQTGVIVILGVAAAIGPLLSVGAALIGVVKGIGAAMLFLSANPIVLLIAGVVALVAALVWLWNNSQTFRDIVTGVFNTVASVVSSVASAMVGALRWAGDTISGIFGGISGAIRGVLNGIIGAINRFISGWNSLGVGGFSIDVPFYGTVTIPRISTPNIGYLPYLATGAWEVMRDTLAYIHQGEMVVPRNFAEGLRSGGGAGLGGWGGPLVYIANYSGGETEDERLARMIERRLGR